MIPTETERKFLIAMPEQSELSSRCGGNVFRMEQSYLSAQPGWNARVRLSQKAGEAPRYFHTEKHRISPMSCLEKEEEIDGDRYEALLETRLPESRTIHKTRYALPWQGHVFEIDVYEFWDQVATMEVELSREDEPFSFPEGITVLRELTGDHRFSNASLAREIPTIEG